MKKVYVRPTIEIENFEANEYVAACYTVTCSEPGISGVFCDFGPYETRNVEEFAHNGNTSHKTASNAWEVSGTYYHRPTIANDKRGHHVCTVTKGWASQPGKPNVSQ